MTDAGVRFVLVVALLSPGDLTPFTATFFGKLVKRAFPAIKDMRKGPRGSAKQVPDPCSRAVVLVAVL